MRWTGLVVFAALVAGCNGNDGKNSDSDVTSDNDNPTATDTDETETDGYPSSYEGGKYRLTSFVLQDDETGEDLDGDGEVDNNLPNLLNLVDAAVDGSDLTADGLNGEIEFAIANDTLVMLVEFDRTDGLALDILGGSIEKADTADPGTIVVSEASYDSDGNAKSHLEGSMTSEAGFEVGPGDVVLPVPFFADADPYDIPVERTEVLGEVDAKVSSGMVVGVIPGDRLLDEVILPLMRDLEYTEEQIAEYEETLQAVLELETMSDIELDDDRRGVSCAFSYTAEVVTW